MKIFLVSKIFKLTKIIKYKYFCSCDKIRKIFKIVSDIFKELNNRSFSRKENLYFKNKIKIKDLNFLNTTKYIF